MDHVISLGSQCVTAALFKHFGFQRRAGPLDWVFSTPEMAAHCIRDEFSDFLDRRQYGARGDRIDHLAFCDRFRKDQIFAHHCPVSEADRYRKGAAALMSALHDETSKLAVIISNADLLTMPVVDDVLGALDCRARNTRLLAIRVGPAGFGRWAQTERDEPKVSVAYFSPDTAIGGMGFGSDADNDVVRDLIAAC